LLAPAGAAAKKRSMVTPRYVESVARASSDGPPLADRASAQDASLESAGGLEKVLRNLDLVVLPIGVALGLALGGPVFGLLVGAGGWLLQRALAVVDRRLIERAAEPGSRLGLDFVDAFARIWVLAGAIILAGAAGHRSDGLAAALVIFFSYSIALAVRIARGQGQRGAVR
jgi:hypothetical protein